MRIFAVVIPCPYIMIVKSNPLICFQSGGGIGIIQLRSFTQTGVAIH